MIGRSWIQVFARAGRETRVYDPDPIQARRALDWLAADLADAVAQGVMSRSAERELRKRVSLHPDLPSALAGVEYVQESGPERLDVKQAIYRELDRHAAQRTILASSTSALDMTRIAEGLEGASRCIVAHPVNPPHVIPAVEVLPGVATRPGVVKRTCTLLSSLGQTPVLLRKYALGFALNRMQAALVREAIDLVESGVTDVNGVDALIRDGLGLRWALLGPFGVGHCNADGGLREYYAKYGSAYIGLMNALNQSTPSFDAPMVDRVATGTEKMEGGVKKIPKILAWRDRQVRRIRMFKAEDPHP